MSIYSAEGGYNVTEEGVDNLAYGQVSVGTTATKIASARPGRNSITIVNSSTTDVFLGDSSVTTSTGVLLSGTKGTAITLPVSAAVYGIVASSTETVSYIEVY